GMTAFQAVLQALIGRERTGEGRHIAVSLYHALADWMNVPYLQFAYGGKVPPRAGLSHPTIAHYGAYGCGDGKAVLFSIQNEREWAAFCARCWATPPSRAIRALSATPPASPTARRSTASSTP